MLGGAGNDTYVVDNAGDAVIENANEGNDTVNASTSFGLSANVENLVLQGGADLQGYGNDLANTLTGNAGNNLLNGGAGADIMMGGGRQRLLFRRQRRRCRDRERQAKAMTLVFSTVHFTLSANVENLILQGDADLQGYGNSDANVIYGNIGNNLLNGGGGVDLLVGGAGNDTYFVDDPSDSCFEVANEGNDTVFATSNYGLAADVENLILQGNADLQAYGNNQANVIYGNAGNNLIKAAGGIDLMVGGAGDDTYFVDDPSDVLLRGCQRGQRRGVRVLPLRTGRGRRDAGAAGQRRFPRLRQQPGEHALRQCRQQPAQRRGGADTMLAAPATTPILSIMRGDVVFENANEGTDVVFASVNYTLTANVEALVLQGGRQPVRDRQWPRRTRSSAIPATTCSTAKAAPTCSPATPATTPSCSSPDRATATPSWISGQRRRAWRFACDSWVTVLARASPTSMQPIGR